jgi:phosphonate transport system substrate-binding protein
MITKFIMAIFVALLVLGCSNQIDESLEKPTEPDRHRTLVLGAIATDDDEVGERKEWYNPILNYIVDNIDSIDKGELKIVNSPAEIATLIRKGEVDFFIETAFQAYVVGKLSDSKPILNGWRGGIEKYHGIIFTKSGSSVTSLEDLKGKIITFEDIGSTSAYLLPKATLLEKGFSLVEVDGAEAKVDPDKIGYYFVYTDDALVKEVMEGRVAASATKPRDVTEYLERHSLSQDDINILHQTIDVYRNIVMVSNKFDKGLKSSLTEVLLQAENDPEGISALITMDNTKRFTGFKEGAFDEFDKLSSVIEEEIIRG